MNRRAFIGSAAAFSTLGCWSTGFGAKPLFKVGIMTDTHVGSWFTKDASRVRQAAELFKRVGVDAIVNVGDICDRHEPKFYEDYRRTVDAVFPPELPHPTEYFVYAWHDAYAYKGHPRDQAYADQDAAFADVERYLRAANPPEFETSIRGYPLVFVRQFISIAKLEEMIERAERAYPGKPVFVFDHVAPTGTSSGSESWGSSERREMLNGHPRVIHISGHTHGTLRNERNIWQGEFTAVNAGCLEVWGKASTHAYGVLVMEVCEDAVIFRRLDVRDGRELGEAWSVSLPFDPKTAPYRLENRRLRNSRAPEFPADAAASLAFTGTGGRTAELSFPHASGDVRSYRYALHAERLTADGRAENLFRDKTLGDFFLSDADRTKGATFAFPAAYLDAGARVRLTVTPCGFFDQTGRSLVLEAVGPEPRDGAVCVFDSRDPVGEMEFVPGPGSGAIYKRDGWWRCDGRMVGKLLLPAEATRAADPSMIRVIVDLRTECAPDERYMTCIAGADNPDGIHLSKTVTLAESGLSCRAVFEYEPENRAPVHCVYTYVNGLKAAGVRFERVRIYRKFAK